MDLEGNGGVARILGVIEDEMMSQDRFGEEKIHAVERTLVEYVEIHAGDKAICKTCCIDHFEISFLEIKWANPTCTNVASVAVELNEPPKPSKTGRFSFKYMRTIIAFGSNCLKSARTSKNEQTQYEHPKQIAHRQIYRET